MLRYTGSSDKKIFSKVAAGIHLFPLSSLTPLQYMLLSPTRSIWWPCLPSLFLLLSATVTASAWFVVAIENSASSTSLHVLSCQAYCTDTSWGGVISPPREQCRIKLEFLIENNEKKSITWHWANMPRSNNCYSIFRKIVIFSCHCCLLEESGWVKFWEVVSRIIPTQHYPLDRLPFSDLNTSLWTTGLELQTLHFKRHRSSTEAHF